MDSDLKLRIRKGSQSGAFYRADYCGCAISPESKNPWIVIRDSGFGEAFEVFNSKSTYRGPAMLPHPASDPPLSPLQGGAFTNPLPGGVPRRDLSRGGVGHIPFSSIQFRIPCNTPSRLCLTSPLHGEGKPSAPSWQTPFRGRSLTLA